MNTENALDKIDAAALTLKIREYGRKLGFSALGVAGAALPADAQGRFAAWLAGACHGQMDYMAKNIDFRFSPERFFPGLRSVISVCLPYGAACPEPTAPTPNGRAAIARYAQGRDYHRIMRRRLQQLADEIQREWDRICPDTPFRYRAFSDSAPVMETTFARLAGIAWQGRHSLSLTRRGSWHFLGELYTSLPLSPDEPAVNRCGRCRRCIDACPTGAIGESGQVDARLCIAYLTIEHRLAIPLELRPFIGNRIYGCDDCQRVCPWNRFAGNGDPAFDARPDLSNAALADLFDWDEQKFNARLSGSPIRRIGHERWLRNIAVALGNADDTPSGRAALAKRLDHPSEMVREHARWALFSRRKRQ